MYFDEFLFSSVSVPIPAKRRRPRWFFWCQRR